MDEDTTKCIMGIILIIAFVGIFIFIIGIMQFGVDYVTINEEITNVEPIIGENGKVDYLNITFANGETYKVSFRAREIDLTVNSKLILQLGIGYDCSWWNSERDYDDYYFISKIIKVPEGD